MRDKNGIQRLEELPVVKPPKPVYMVEERHVIYMTDRKTDEYRPFEKLLAERRINMAKQKGIKKLPKKETQLDLFSDEALDDSFEQLFSDEEALIIGE